MNRSIVLILMFNVGISVVIVASSHSWFSVWVGLELNTLSILPVLCSQFTPRGVESTVKYFLVQAFSAAMILNVAMIQLWLSSSWSIDCPLNYFSSIVLTMALSLKLGLFPCHYWFPDVVQGLSFLQGLLLSTWQKVAPLVILISVSGMISFNMLVILGCLSVLVGGWGGLNQSQVRKIMAFSSISHLGWISSVVAYSWYMSCAMFIIYSILSSTIFLINSEVSLYNLSSLGRLMYCNSAVGFILILVILSLGGLPPLTGFLNKFVALECLLSNSLFIPCVFLIIGSLLSLFFYLRIGFNSILCLFPQHSMMLFSWRSVGGYNSSINFSSVMLGGLSSLSILGLVLIPAFWCYH
uniref:NADH dehydrogenase subunit 2 n=1 Tax=Coscinasterias acutispina TaxID=60565 RepID=UPI002028C37D|nr:NADH dehydrogenase subunit 2 [Coscinasterias acutispina]UPY85812.1 NADH dehydrogenase subunit 2 [Coscinasterias acutispina]